MQTIPPATSPTPVQPVSEIEYAHGAHDPWRSLANLAAIFGMIHGVLLTSTGGQIISTSYRQGSNMLVELFFLGRFHTFFTIVNLVQLFAGALLTVSAALYLAGRSGARVRFVICVVIGALAILCLDLWEMRGGGFWSYHMRMNGPAAAVAALLRRLLTPIEHMTIPAILIWIMTRPQIKTRGELMSVKHV